MGFNPRYVPARKRVRRVATPEISRRYATEGRRGLACRGLKPTVNVMSSLRDGSVLPRDKNAIHLSFLPRAKTVDSARAKPHLADARPVDNQRRAWKEPY